MKEVFLGGNNKFYLSSFVSCYPYMYVLISRLIMVLVSCDFLQYLSKFMNLYNSISLKIRTTEIYINILEHVDILTYWNMSIYSYSTCCKYKG